MRIAVTYADGQVFPHFGHTELFRIYDVEQGRVTHRMTIRPINAGHEAMVGVLKKVGADTLICGGIGDGAQRAGSAMGLNLYAGVSGSADEAVAALLRGSLKYVDGVTCTEHGSCGHECGGSCGRNCGHN